MGLIWACVGFRVYCLAFSKTRRTFVKVPMIRIIICWGVKGGPLVEGSYH